MSAYRDISSIAFIIGALRKLRGMHDIRDCGDGAISWEVSEECRFWTALYVLSPTHSPLVGIGAPGVMAKVNELQKRSGVQLGAVDWHCLPVFSIPMEAVRYVDPNADSKMLPAFDFLHKAGTFDLKEAEDALTVLLSAEELLVEKAGTLAALLDFGRDRLPYHPTMSYLIPVGYCTLGNLSQAHTYMAARREAFKVRGETELGEFYDKFVEEVRREFG